MEIILYLSNGYPTLEASLQMAKEYADAGCGMIEIDFPSSNPYLESQLIKDRMAKALEECSDYEKYMEEIVAVKKALPNVKLLVLAYENTVKEIGVEKFINFCLDNDFKDVLLVGLSNNEVKDQIIAAGLRVSCYVQFQMLEEEIELAKASNGFVYLQAVVGFQTVVSVVQLKTAFRVLNDHRRQIRTVLHCFCQSIHFALKPTGMHPILHFRFRSAAA